MTRIEASVQNTEIQVETRFTIRRGDTLSEIAARHHVGLKALQAANPGVNPLRLQIGQSINIPPAPRPLTLLPHTPLDNHVVNEFDRAFKLTQSVESGKQIYAAYQNSDKGIVSYGCIQFTLHSGNLQDVVERFTAASDSSAADTLRKYIPWPQNLESLRHDKQFAQALKTAAHEQPMQAAQIAVAKEKFWDPAQQKAADLGLNSALSKAILFDTNVQGGMNIICKRTNERLSGQTVSEHGYLEVFLNERTKYLESVAPQSINRLDTFWSKLYAGNMPLD